MTMSMLAVCVIGVTALSAVVQDAPAPRDAPAVRVMSFNLRYGAANDGANGWRFRRDAVLGAIVADGPDVLGVQECLPMQRDWLAERLAGYTFVGVGRENGRGGDEAGGEIAGLFVRDARFEVVEWGTRWLSETPDEVGSVGWDAALTRTLTWAVLRERGAEGADGDGAREWLVINTHYDHRGGAARTASAAVVHETITAQGGGRPVIVTGDFNARPGGDAHAALLGDGVLMDTWLAAGHEEDGAGTFNGFTPGATDGPRIDWVLVSPGVEVLDAGIDRTTRSGGRYPSDHFPVTATVRVSGGQGG